jgi:DNA-binding transcriptional MocR family regulator
MENKMIINRNSMENLYLQVVKELKKKILSKEYFYGHKLPSERDLARELGVNRSTIIKAFDVLKAEEMIKSFTGKGTVVIYKSEDDEKGKNKPIIWSKLLNNYSTSDSSDIMLRIMNTQKKEKKVIAFSGGFPSLDLLPMSMLNNIANRIFDDRETFMQGSVYGDDKLINSLKVHLKTRNINANSSNILVTSGSQQGLDLVVRTFVEPLDNVLIESPSFFGGVQALYKAKAKIFTFDVRNPDFDYIEYLLANKKMKFIYLMPNFQNPTGNVYSVSQKLKFLNLARKYAVPIIEEDPYGELSYEENVYPLKSYDRNENVIYIGTFSKTIATGIRVGYTVSHPDVLNKLIRTKEYSDIHSSTISQRLISEFLDSKSYYEHLENSKKHYKDKMITCISILDKIEGIEYYVPSGGYYLWIKVLKRIPINKLLEKALLNGIEFVPGEFFGAFEGEYKDYIRLNFTYESNDNIFLGLNILKDLINNWEV